MRRYLIRRLLQLGPVLIGTSLLAFGLAALTPGDPAEQMLYRISGQEPTTAEIEALRAELGLDDPLPVQYVRWLADVVRGDLGTSFRYREPVSAVLLRFLPNTALLALAATVVTLALAFPVGILAAVARNSWLDQLTRVGALVGASMPGFWLGYLLIIVFAVRLHWLPAAGHGSARHLVLPALTLGIGSAAVIARLLRSSLLEVLADDYVRTARAKGVRGRLVVTRHALPNALLPVVTVLGMHLGHLLGGTVIIEVVFAWPGVGHTVVEGIFARDYPLIQGFVLLMGVLFVLINLLVDLLYTRLDPRVRLAAAVGVRS